MSDDADLLRGFVESGSETDLTELVRRNAALVYHAALRRTGGRADLAEEVSQYVFTTLVQQAPKLVGHSSLAGWLFTTTRNGAYRLLREEERRRKRETKFAAMTELSHEQAQAEWEKLRPHLDELLDQLPDSDREAVLLRYVQGHSLSEVGAEIGLNSDSTRKRIDRAMDRLRAMLIKRGLMTSTAVVAELLTTEANAAAPAQLATRLAATALKNALPTTSSAALGAAGIAGASISGAAAIGIALVAITVGGSAIGFSIRQARAAEAILASTQQSYRLSETRLVKLQTQRLKILADSSSFSNEPTPVPKASAPTSNAVSSPAPGTPEALANGARFLSTVPGARTGLSSFLRTQQHATFSGFYRTAKLNPSEIDAFEQRVAEYRLASVELTHDRMVTTAGDLPVDQVQALLGADRAKLYKEYLPSLPARFMALEAAAAGGYSAEPISPMQVDEVTRILTEANGTLKTGGKLDPATEDWSAAVPALKALFTPTQWTAVEGYFTQQQYEQLLHKLQAAAPMGTSTKTEGEPLP